MRALALQGVATSRRWLVVSRLWEILPGLAAWIFLLSPLILSWFEPMWVAYLIIGYDLLWLSRSFGMSYRLVRGYGRLRRTMRADWQHRLEDLEDIPAAIERVTKRLQHEIMTRAKRLELKRYLRYLKQQVKEGREILKPSELYQAVLVTTYNETLETLEPTIQSVVDSHYNHKRIWLIIAYEERGGEATQRNAEKLIKRYGRHFGHAEAIKHPANLPGEAVAKAGNINFAARRLTKQVRSEGIDPAHVLVTTLDADNRPAPQYFAHLSFIYATTPNRTHKSYQPIPMFLNNIWDA
ncbi:glycosyltransferase, partial [Candidatus Microgenomates bacterium]|nr:glycosyltransferase [Candidatus Microgenomates bacterium]